MVKCDVLLICAVDSEEQAVVSIFDFENGQIENQSSKFKDYKYKNINYKSARLANQAGVLLDLHLVKIGKGNNCAFKQIPSLITNFRPRFVAMTGKCIGNPKHGVELGDLMIFQNVFNGESVRITKLDQRIIHEFDKVPTGSLDYVSALAVEASKDIDWLKSLAEMRKMNNLQIVKESTIRVANSISAIALRRDGIFDNTSYDEVEWGCKIQAADMESYAFYNILNQKLTDCHYIVPGLVVKAVSDFGDPNKNDQYEQYCCESTALFILHFIKTYLDDKAFPEQEYEITSETMIFKNSNLSPDWKNILISRSISNSLVAFELNHNKPPSFAECVRNCQKIIVNVHDKHLPLSHLHGLEYNHYFGPSAIISIYDHVNDKDYWLYYTRKPKGNEPGYRLTQGRSFLFHASFHYQDFRASPKVPMDLWMEEVQKNPSEATNKLIGGVQSILMDLIRYKIDLPKIHQTTIPFGVLTRDTRNPKQREAGLGRIYTQYVFWIKLMLGMSYSVDKFISDHFNDTNILYEPNPNASFEFGKNHMDGAIWKAISEKPENSNFFIYNNDTIFRRGFQII